MDEKQNQEEKNVKGQEDQNSENYKYRENHSYLDELIEMKKRQQEAEKAKELEAQNKGEHQCQNQEEDEKQYYDKPGTMENTTAIVLYIIAMVVGSIFKDRIFVYLGATFLLILFLCRHKLNKKNKK